LTGLFAVKSDYDDIINSGLFSDNMNLTETTGVTIVKCFIYYRRI